MGASPHLPPLAEEKYMWGKIQKRKMTDLNNAKTLVLNADYMPLSVIGWQDAITIVHVKKTAVELDFYKNLKIKDGHGKAYTVPAVCVRKKYIKRDYRLVPFSRKNVFIRDELTCQYCGVRYGAMQLTLDHVIPKSKWKGEKSPTNFTNIVAACYNCNRKKANHSCTESGMHPIKKPVAPNYAELVMGISPWKKTPNEWIPYLEHLPLFKKYMSSTT